MRPLRPAALASLAAFAFALAAWRPDWALAPAASLVSQVRQPAHAIAVTRALFLALCALSMVLAIGWGGLHAALGRAIDAMGGWSPMKFWTVAAITAVALRALTLLLPFEPTSDAAWYHAVATSLADGAGFSYEGTPTAYRSPGYPLLLAALYRAFGSHVQLAWVLGAAATALLMVSVHTLAARMYGTRVARIAVLLAGAYPALVLATRLPMSDLVFSAGTCALLAWVVPLERPSVRAVVGAGAAVGVLTLVRTVAFGLCALLPVLWWLRDRRTGALARNLLLCASACAALLWPWAARNAEVLGRFSLGTNFGINLAIGNHAGASGWYERVAPVPTVAAAGEVALDDALRRQALDFIAAHPVETASLIPRKLAAMYLLETEVVTSLFQGTRRAPGAVHAVLLCASQLAWVAIAALVALRLARAQVAVADRPMRVQVWIVVGYFTAVTAIFFGADRFRWPAFGCFLVEAAAAIGWLACLQPRSRSMSPLSSSSEPN